MTMMTHRTLARRAVGAVAAVVLLAVLAACGTPATPPVEAPEISAFSADPASIVEGSSSTLSWTVVGDATVSLTDGTDPVPIPSGASSVVVSPSETTTYTLTAVNPGGTVTAQATVEITVPGPPPSVTGLVATTVAGSQVQLDWTASDAVSIDVLTVANDDPTDEILETTLVASATSYTFAIPASTRQVVRVCARSTDSADDACDDVTLTNVVVRGDDYDPYDLTVFEPEDTIPGTLRAVLDAAASGSTIGFASDVNAIDLYGVALWPPGTGNNDAHVVIDKDITISGPPSGVTLTGRSGYEAGVDPDDGADPPGFTYRSRMIYVAPDVDVVLENLTIKGGTFIYKGGGIRNEGTLTATNVTVTENRAWDIGGGISNSPTGDLTLVDSVVSENEAVTRADEVGTKYDIRGNFLICMFATGYGGGVFNEAGGVVALVDTDVTNNTSVYSGGGIYNEPGGTITVTGGVVSGNVADSLPITSDPAYPELPWFPEDDPLDPDDCGPVTTSPAVFVIGGGIYNGGSFDASGMELLDNAVRGGGGGLFIDRNLEQTVLTDVLIQGNEAGVNNPPGFGGGILHEFFETEGPDSNYTPSTVSYGTGNTPQDYLQNEIPGGAGLLAPQARPGDGALPGRYVPRPGMVNR